MDTVKFNFFERVWLVIDETGEDIGVGQVIGILYKPNGVLYQVQWGLNKCEYHYAEELTGTKPNKFAAL